MKICCICKSKKEKHKFIRGNAFPTCKLCKDKLNKEYHAAYRKNNKAAILLGNKIYKKKRRETDPGFRLANNCSRMINIALNGSKLNYSIWDFLPYTIDDLKKHLESKFDNHMTWNNYGTYWHVDHIIPQSSFKYSTMSDDNFIHCWSLDNLRPFEALANIKKSNRINHEIT